MMNNRRRTLAAWLLALSLVVAASVLIHAEQYAGEIYASSDARAVEAFKVVGDQMLAKGEYPLWNPYVFMGMPSFASLAYTPWVYPLDRPITVLTKGLHLVPMTWLLVHVVLLGVGTLGYLRWRGQSWAASIAAACAMMATPKIVAWSAYGHGTKVMSVAWMPWVLWMLEGTLRRRSWAWGLGLAAVLGTALLRAHVQITYYMAIAGFFWFCFLGLPEWKREGWARALPRRGGWLAVVLVLALAVSMALFLPVLEYQAHSVRGAASTGGGVGFDYATNWSLSFSELPTLWWPTAAGYGKASYVGSMPFTDYPNYIGLPVLLLAGIALMLRRDRWTWMLLALALFATLASLGRHFFLYRVLFEALPGFNKFRVPVMILVLQNYALLLLAAAGLDLLVQKLASKERPAWLGRGLLLPLAGVGVLFLILGSVGSGFLAEQSVSRWTAMRPGVPFEALRAAADLARNDALRLGLLFLAAGATAVAYSRGRFPGLALASVLGLFLFVDLFSVGRPIIHPESYLMSPARDASGRVVAVPATPVIRELAVVREYVAATGAIEFLKSQGVATRVWPLGALAGENLYAAHDVTSLGGYHPAKLKVYEDLRERLYPREGSPEFRLVDLLGAGWVHVASPLDLQTLEALAQRGLPLEERFRGDGGVVYQHLAAGPRAWLVGEFELEKPGVDTSRQEPGSEILQRVLSPRFDPRRRVILSAEPSPVPQPGAVGDVRVVEESDQRIVFETQSSADAVAVFADVYYPDWKVRVDGEEAPLLRADHALRAVAVAAGTHRVEFEYLDASYRTGKLLSRLAWGVIFLGLGITAFLARREATRGLQSST